MRQDFRVKIDISRIYQDARQYSWIFIDSTKIFYVNQFVNHVRKIFNIEKPFHLLSRHEDTCFFLPFEEDIRVLENNDTVVIVPGTGINDDNISVMKSDVDSLSKVQSNCREASKNKESDLIYNQSYTTDKSSQNSTQNVSEIPLFNDTLYRTALHDVVTSDTKDSEITEDNYTEEQLNPEKNISNKRKRVRKRKQKKPADVVLESDISLNETSGKKPKVIDSILITSGGSGKHIRFKSLDNDITSDVTAYENNVHQILQTEDTKNKQNISKDLTALLNLRQSSTPLTFVHKRIKKEYNDTLYKPESIQEQEMSIESDEKSNQINTSLNGYKLPAEVEKSKIQTPTQKRFEDDDNNTVSFKVFKIGEDYTPQISNVIIAQILSSSAEGSQYTMKLLHGKDQLKEPEGKFSLPKDKENSDDHDGNDDDDDIITLEKSKLLEFTRIKAIDTPK
ncbi:uncharacterized protein LOC131673454 [Phymastichus coffea]|uniref:uncharacterized protein LOC131673454 n=1 Tax=Phymastichus coffea TaxID=108790 RepID=UPI00273B684E|nr:uncharacterized protein LOC131673454 [Phymastichus coffea]